MLHSKHITLTKGKTSASSTKTRVKVNKGVIYRAWLTFPAGCAGLVKVKMLLDEHQILPVEEDKFINGDAHVFEYPLFEEIKLDPQLITIDAWNEDATYNHTINVQLLVIPKEWIIPVGAYEGIVASLRSLFEGRK